MAAESDPGALQLTDEQMSTTVSIRELRRCQKLANKKQLASIRYSLEVIDYLKASGAGCQTRMDAVIKDLSMEGSRRTAEQIIRKL